MSVPPVVLDEDTYTAAISKIIERDFFPHLSSIRAKNNYDEAQRSGTLLDLEKAIQEMRQASKPVKSPPPGKAVNYYNEDAEELEDRVNLNLTLDQFQTLYTSEDNASFTEILAKTNAQRREKYKWLNQKQLLLGPATEPALLEYKARNALMYFPEGTGESTLDEKSSRAGPKKIEYRNIHIPDESSEKKGITLADLASRGGGGLKEGGILPWQRLSGVDEDGQSILSEQQDDKYRGYRLVDSTPSPAPSRMGTPMMTWGTVEGTPLMISSGQETPGPRFSMQQVPKREELGMKLSEKASRAHRRKATDKSVKGTPRTGAGLMSPAARHLLRRSHTPTSSGFGNALRSSYASSPSFKTPRGRTPGATPTPLFRAGATPSQSAFKTPIHDKKTK
ncbi:hypothetical protein VTP01DRAFT_3702 [Rhizomucor pusillus]|uniref:uncharacterized protein n=1 Tax=Rhizomucor pusillus TaxID=4840 RepID=UPI003742BC31